MKWTVVFMYLLFILAGIFISPIAKSQDVHFSQFDRAPLFVNPSLAGPEDSRFRFLTNYRDQWKSIANPYRTMAASFDMNLLRSSFDQGFLGAGLSFYSDKAGDSELGLTRGDLSLSYHNIIDKKNIFTAGMQGSYVQQTINDSKLQWGTQFDGDQYDASLPSQQSLGNSFSYADFSGGLSWSHRSGRNFSARTGIALYHINKPKDSFLRNENIYLSRKFTLFGESLIKIPASNYAFAPELFIAEQKAATELVIGSKMLFTFKEASVFTGFIKETTTWFGLHYRAGDALIFSLGIDKMNYSVSFSYDATLSALNTADNYMGGMEVSLKITDPKSFYYKKSRAKF